MNDDMLNDGEAIRAYIANAREEPRPAVDTAIRAAARQPRVVAAHRSRWTSAFAIAATVVLTFSLVMVALKQPAEQGAETGVPVARQEANEQVAVPPEAALQKAPLQKAPPYATHGAQTTEADSQAVLRQLEQQRRSEAKKEAAGALGAAPASPPAAHGELRERADKLEAQTPEQWLERIRTLRKQRLVREASEQLAEFRRHYPEYRLPDDLR